MRRSLASWWRRPGTSRGRRALVRHPRDSGPIEPVGRCDARPRPGSHPRTRDFREQEGGGRRASLISSRRSRDGQRQAVLPRGGWVRVPPVPWHPSDTASPAVISSVRADPSPGLPGTRPPGLRKLCPGLPDRRAQSLCSGNPPGNSRPCRSGGRGGRPSFGLSSRAPAGRGSRRTAAALPSQRCEPRRLRALRSLLPRQKVLVPRHPGHVGGYIGRRSQRRAKVCSRSASSSLPGVDPPLSRGLGMIMPPRLLRTTRACSRRGVGSSRGSVRTPGFPRNVPPVC